MLSHKLPFLSLLSILFLATTATPIPIPPGFPQHEQRSPQVKPTPDELLANILAGNTPQLPPNTHIPVAGAAAAGSNHRTGGQRGRPVGVVGHVNVKPIAS